MDRTCSGVPGILADDGQGVRFTTPDCGENFYLYYAQSEWLATVRTAQHDGTAISVGYDDDQQGGPNTEDRVPKDVHAI
ncbi:hypothetical protein SBA3_290015 [Candidatus Sulfopaludibacter sp. SbA3]|nr:hypothetical protein SBA3_290015 [Candidatus Sulfopaludibacter sp. SbA3]